MQISSEGFTGEPTKAIAKNEDPYNPYRLGKVCGQRELMPQGLKSCERN